jgi:hypothetical protein
VLAALDRVSQTRDVMSRALALARTWEEMVVDGRPAIVEEIARLGVTGQRS